jgi:hypothetical protein
MSKIGFVCPDNQTTLIKDCFRKCRMKRRCATMPYLRLIAEDRERPTADILKGHL